MKKIGRNEPCPCGSGKKFKFCHLGKEDDLAPDGTSEISPAMSARITALPRVQYGRSREMLDVLDIGALTGSTMGVKFVDLKAYHDLDVWGGPQTRKGKEAQGGVVVNVLKTGKSDPDNIYVAISPKIGESALVHQLAHVLEYLVGSKSVPGIAAPLSFDLGIPVEHLEHSQEFGCWLNYLEEQFKVQLDADDTIISYLYKKNMLIKGEDIEGQNRFVLKSKSDQILRFLSEHSEEIDAMIQELPGYIGSRVKKE